MTDHPSTYNATDTHREGVDWDDRSAIHENDDGRGLLDGAKAVHRGTLAEMIRIILNMPEDDRGNFVIQKAGDHRLTIGEIMALASREDFPG